MPVRQFTDEALLELGREAFQKLGPDCTAMECAREMGVSSSTVRNRFRSWLVFRERLGIGPRLTRMYWNRRHTRTSLLRAARELVEDRGPAASLAELCRRAGVSNGTIYRHFGTWAALREAAGLPPPCPRNTKYTTEELLELGRAAYRARGCNITLAEFTRHSGISSGVLAYRFGGWKPFREQIGEHPRNPGNSKLRSLDYEEIIERLRDYAERHGPHFSQREFARRTGISPYLITSRLNSWAEARERADLESHPRMNRQRYTNEFLLDDLVKVGRTVRRMPTQRDYKVYGIANVETVRKRLSRDWGEVQQRVRDWLEYKAAFPNGLPPMPCSERGTTPEP